MVHFIVIYQFTVDRLMVFHMGTNTKNNPIRRKLEKKKEKSTFFSII